MYKQSEYPPAVQKHTHQTFFYLSFGESGVFVEFYKLLLRRGTVVVHEYFSICSIVIYPNSMQIKKRCYI